MPDTLSLTLSTRPAIAPDLPFLHALQRATGGEGGPPPALAGAAVVLLDGQPVGLLRVHRGSRDWAIQQVQLLPAYRRAGIGSRLIAEVLAEARDQGARVSLSVLKSNPARGLYERLGFTVTAECENGYSMRAG